jgi:hypothetical protein
MNRIMSFFPEWTGLISIFLIFYKGFFVATCSPHQDTGLTNQLHTLLTTDKLKYNMDKYDMQAQNRRIKTTLYKHFLMNYM